MNKTLVVEFEIFEEDEIKVLSVVDPEKDAVVKMFNGQEAEQIFKNLTE